MTSVFCLLATFLQLTPVDLTVVTVPSDSRVDIPLAPNGEVEIRRGETLNRLRLQLDQIEPLTNFGSLMRAYVVWAVSPEGEVRNLGELELDGRRARLETTTQWQRFGILVTAEPYFLVDGPSASVAFRSAPPRDNDIRVQPVSLTVGEHDYSAIQLPPQGALPPRITQARMALRVAADAATGNLAAAELREARVAVDSMEDLLRRGMRMDVLLPYVNDAIRLSARAARVARAQVREAELREVTRRAESLSRENEQLQQRIRRVSEEQLESGAREEARLNELQELRNANRTLELEQADAARRLRVADTEMAGLRDPWPPLSRALLRAGARETPRGLLLRLPADSFGRNTNTLETSARELLARVTGILTFGEVIPEVWIEGHTSNSGPESRNLPLSLERAEAVRLLLTESGVPESNVRAEGFGSSTPLAGTEDSGQQGLNERVDIIVRNFRSQ